MSDYENDVTAHPQTNSNCPGYLRLTRDLLKHKPAASTLRKSTRKDRKH